ncbi:MAG: TonB-dependent receptor [Prevotella sp.]|nr:TonB-dependent receptor [Prevotella sp.]
MEKRIMTLLAMLFLFLGGAFSQTRVNGTVVSQDDGEPVIGATVQVVGTQVGTVTNSNGQFSLTCPAGSNTLRITYVGMEPLEVSARPNMRILLTSDQTALDEVIVVAYGTQKRSAFTGSAAQLTSKQIESHVASNVMSALAGSTPGVQVMSTNGDPASNAPTIRIRGIGSMSASNSPLYVVDGMPYDGNVNAINPNDVESMTVLKDAAASAIYGARGANGVVIITTKKGRDQDAEIKFDAKWGSNSRLIPQYDVIDNPAQYYELAFRQLYNSEIYAGKSHDDAYAFANANLFNQSNGGLGYQVFTVPEGQNLIGTNFKLNPNATLGYSDGQYYYTPDDWYDETYHNSFRQEYNVSTSGVTDRINYYGSVGYLKDGGLVNNSEMQRYTARLNVDYQVKKWIKLGANLSFTHSDSDSPSYSTSNYMSSGNLFYIVNNMGPIYPLYVRNADGTIMKDDNGLTIYDANQTNQKRPSVVGNAVRDNEVNRSKTYADRFNGKWQAIITPIEGLTLTASMSAYASNVRENNLYSKYGSSSNVDGGAYARHQRSFAVTNQYLANYRTAFAEDTHHLEVLAGYEQYRLKYQNINAYNDHLFNPFIGEVDNAVGSDNKTLHSYTDSYMTEGYLGRVQYDYQDKYFVSASFRRDASSRFAPGHRWGSFGSVGLAWEMKKESFLQDVNWIDLLKVKVSYGVQGNDNVGDNVGTGSHPYYPYSDMYTASYNPETGNYSLVLTQKGNEELTWETSKSLNIGVDFSLFNSRLNGTIEYFNRKTEDLLYNKPLPLSAGIVTGSFPMNIGAVRNSGFEISLDGVILKTRDITWSANLNLTHYKNKILELDPTVAENGIKRSYYIYTVGGSLFNSYMYKYAGVDHETGKALYYYNLWQQEQATDDAGNLLWNDEAKTDPKMVDVLDKDGNRIYTGEVGTTDNFSEADQYDCGTTLPKLYGGFGTTLTAYGFDLSAQFQFQLGGKFYDGTYQALMHTSDQAIGSAWHKDALDFWDKDTNPNSNVPRLDDDFSVSQAAIDRFMTSSNYLSINNVTLGYTFPRNWISKLSISSLRVYVAGENLAVFTKRKGMDPRFSLGIGSYVYGSGATTNYYSALRNITAGLTVSF